MEEQKPTYIGRALYWLKSKTIPLNMRTKPLFEEGELEQVLNQIREDKEKYEQETGKPYNVPLA